LKEGAVSAGYCCLFLGPELGQKQDALNELRKRLSQKGTCPEETSFYAGETGVSEMVDILRNGALFADSRLFLIKNAELIKKKEDVKPLVSYMASPQDDTVLVLMSENTSLDKGLESGVSRENRKLFYELFENQKTDWVASFFRRKGFEINAGAIETILELVENNTEALGRECSRLVFFLDKDKTIGPEDVEEWLSHTRTESPFTLFARIAAGDFPRALESLHTLLASKEEDPRGIFSGLAWCFRKLRDYLFLADSGRLSDFDLRNIGLSSPKSRDNYVKAARRYDSAGTEACLALTAGYDTRLLIFGKALEPVLMDLYLYKIFQAVKT
jgi:DNA polymerase-3 subunit delta